MIAMLGLGVAFAAGIWIVWRAVVPAAPDVLGGVRRWDRDQRHSLVLVRADARPGMMDRVGRRCVGVLTSRGIRLESLQQDLAIAGKQPEEFFARAVPTFLAGVLVVLASQVPFGVLGVWMPLPALVMLGLGVGLAACVGEYIQLRSHARARRAELLRGLMAYLQYVSACMRAGLGLPEALHTAGQNGNSWAFRQLTAAVERGRDAGITAGEAFQQLGAEYGLSDLQDFGGSLNAAGTDGAKIRDSLVDRAGTLWQKQLSGENDRDNAAADMMPLYQIVGVFAFIGYIIYPLLVGLLAI